MPIDDRDGIFEEDYLAQGPFDDEFDEGSQEVESVDTEILVRRAMDIISSAKSMPLSSSVLIARDEILELLEAAMSVLPEEIKQARWMLKERDEFLERTRRDAQDILEEARSQAARLVERTEVVRQAQMTARKTIDDAHQEASRLMHDAEDFCDKKLAAFEIVLDRTLKVVNAGREKLNETLAPIFTDAQEGDLFEEISGQDSPASEGAGSSLGDVFFDQDQA